MAANESNGTVEDVSALFSQLGDLEKSFADIELAALRRREHDLKPLFAQREKLLSQIPQFWPTVFLNGPEEVQSMYSPADLPILSAITSFSVERYQIKSHEEGEPRSLRFTFQFAENPYFSDTKLVKELEYKPSPSGGPGSLVSKAVPIKWRSKKMDLTRGLLDAAVELEAAEQAMKVKKGSVELDLVDRDALWQYEKLREKLEKEEQDDAEEISFMGWFGFRGAVAERPEKKAEANGDTEDEEDSDDEDEAEGMLDVEIFPAGEEVAMTLADEMWPGVMDYFMRAQEDPAEFEGLDGSDDADEDGDDGDDDEPPELVAEGGDVKDNRPRKRQRTG